MVALGNLSNGANLVKFQVEGQEARKVSGDKVENRNQLLEDLFKATGIDSEKLGDYVGKTVKVTAHLVKDDVTATDVYTVVIK